MKLVLFNFEMDQKSQALAFAIDWINEIAKNIDKLYVVSLRCKEYKVRHNVEVICIKQDKKNKLQTILSIWKALKYIHKKDRVDGYFVHMAHYFVPIIYPFAKFYNQKIVLWYAHKSVTISLKIANFFTDIVVTSTKQGYRIKTNKLKILSQGIDTNKFNFKNQHKNIKNIAVIGRISRIKNVKEIVESFTKLDNDDLKLYIVGDIMGDKTYLKEIREVANNNVVFVGSIPFNRLHEFYKNIDLTINLSDTGSLDKVIVESMAMGIPVITSNESAKELFKHLDNKGVFLIDKSQLKEKLNFILNHQDLINNDSLRKEIIHNHSLNNLIKKIIGEFK